MENDSEEAKTNDWFHRWVLFGLFPYPERLRRALIPARIAQRLRFDRLAAATGLLRLLPPRLRQLVEMLPPPEQDEGPLPAVLPAVGPKRATVALFTGCVGDALFRATNWATARVLQQNGCEVHVPETQQCCGAIHFHAGSSEPAHEFAAANAAAFASADFDAIITNVAGCGSMLKDYALHWPDGDAQELTSFAEKVRDVNEFLAALPLVPPRGELPWVATYHDACHLAHAQRVVDPPRALLQQIPGLTLRPLPESDICCGAAGTYNLTEPEMSQRLSRRKMDNIVRSGARVVITSNAGCILQIARQARNDQRPLRVVHPMQLLDWSYRGVQPS